MSASTLQPVVVAAYEEARKQLTGFHEAVNKQDTAGAASALQSAAVAICRGLTAAVDDSSFWAQVTELVKTGTPPAEALDAVLKSLEAASQEEARILQTGGYSAESIGILLGNFELTLATMREAPTANSVELTRDRVKTAQKVICELSSRPVEIEKKSWWGRGYRRLVNGLKVLGGVGTIVTDTVAVTVSVPAGGVLTPLAVGLAFASVGSGIATIASVGEDIFGVISRRG